MNKYDSIVAGSLDIAQSLLVEKKNTQLSEWHLAYGLVKNPSSFSSRALKNKLKDIKSEIERLPQASQEVSLDNVRPTAGLSKWLTLASSNAIQSGRQEVTETDLLKHIVATLSSLNIDPNTFSSAMNGDDEEEVPAFLTNLNEMATEGKLDPVIGRSKEIRAVMEILGRRGKNNPVLVGPAGVGKTAIVEGLAEMIVKGTVADVLEGKTVYALDMGALIAGTKFRGEFEERLQKLLKYIKQNAATSILFIDEIHQLVGAGKTDGAMDAANLLKPALARGELNCIGATTDEEYQKYILGDSALERRFRAVPVNEPSKEDAIEILMGIREKLEIHHGIKISDDAIFNSVILSDQYITDKNLPDKAIDLVDEAASALKLSAEAMPAKLVELEAEIRSKKVNMQIDKDNEKLAKEVEELEKKFNEQKSSWEEEVLSLKRVSELKNQRDRLSFELEAAERNQDYEKASMIKYSQLPEVEKELESCHHDWVLATKDIALVISRQKGIPVEKILKSKQAQILQLEGFLKSRVFGQDEALTEIADTIVSAHAGLTDPSRPLGSFLLKGPSGVGKTETAKALCEFLFDTQDNLIRFDLSEFSEKHSVSKLIGAAPGYVGYEEGGVLTEAVRRHPYSVILFDEIEKAHYDFGDILLQILDDGRLTDNKGRTIDFKNTIILLTTNAKVVETAFKPEVLGRLDSVLTYNALDRSIMNSLIDKQVRLLNSRLLGRKLKVDLSESVRTRLNEQGYSEAYGARPLASIFNRLVTRPLSKEIMAHDLEEKDLKIDYKDSQIVIN
ncbi:putative chaperone protein ClpB [Bacteriovorax sp. BAL6_X]|uniref:ATP-dependent Clp protease ATP-binding subunit n=1 Tax=Bacteriovorax sp. BAL6_X TaxID=1201290 RepID=UPI0003861431|nr:AAA family ATPase [Bacteriovorax sp. BAL6_X]EPZ50691.1 putative chaperone protein ClpB [Bacteriovorax sp. BAL6_X]